MCARTARHTKVIRLPNGNCTFSLSAIRVKFNMKSMEIFEKLQKCVNVIRQKTDFVPQIALVLGSGLGNYADTIRVETVVAYSELPDFPHSTVQGHAGRFVFGYVNEIPVVIMQGRVHYYEGYDIRDVVLPIRLMGCLGAKVLFLTNAAGGIMDGMQGGDLMVIRDQIACLVPSPLAGPNMDDLGPRFPDMSEIYSADLRKAIREAADEEQIMIKEGVYIQTAGPQYETPAEIRAFKAIGADAVGMSTGCEAIAARHMGMQVCGISCISNLAAGISDRPLSHKEVQEAADRVAADFSRLVTRSIIKIAGMTE